MNKYLVVPHAGTWIEIAQEIDLPEQKTVVPHAGTWIEIFHKSPKNVYLQSFPTRERGLKS